MLIDVDPSLGLALQYFGADMEAAEAMYPTFAECSGAVCEEKTGKGKHLAFL